jgi:gamma-glutamylcyclotransferase
MTKIFAYGSNMCTARLRARVPSARALGVAALSGHSLRFHKRGWRDGSGKGDAFRTDDPAALVWGVVFRIAIAGKSELDRIEGAGRGYDPDRVEVAAPDGTAHRAWVYLAAASAIDPAAVPFRWYRDLILAGAREHGLPDHYVRRIARQPTRPDPDRERARRHRDLIERQVA